MARKVKNEQYYLKTELRKLINSWELLPGYEFDELNEHLINALQTEFDDKKLMSILDSELVITYGLSPTKTQLKTMVKQVVNWWTSKR